MGKRADNILYQHTFGDFCSKVGLKYDFMVQFLRTPAPICFFCPHTPAPSVSNDISGVFLTLNVVNSNWQYLTVHH